MYRVATGYSQPNMWLAHEWVISAHKPTPRAIKELIDSSPSDACWFVEDASLLAHDEQVEIWIVNKDGKVTLASRYKDWGAQLNLLKDKPLPINPTNYYWDWKEIQWGLV